MEMTQNQTLWNIFKSDSIFHWLQNTKIFQRLLQLVSFKSEHKQVT